MNERWWKILMVRWSSELMAGDLAESVSPPPQSPEWLGFDPAGRRDLKRLEDRLGMSLPPSYRLFLLMSNGWRRTTFAVDRIRPAAEVEWFHVENEHWIDAYSGHGSDLPDEDYYDYPEGSAPDHRSVHLKSLVQISDVDDGVYLLNPEAVTPDGEWEAWFFADWVPGAIRFPSFAHMMLREYLSFARPNQAAGPIELSPLPVPGPEIPRIPAKRARKKGRKVAKVADDFSIDQLIEQMRELEGKPLDRALRTFHQKLIVRPPALRRAELISVLVDLFHSARQAGVRSACVAAIAEWAVEPPPVLLESLSDRDPWVVLSGIHALHHFPNPSALEPLCRFIESRGDAKVDSHTNAMVSENAMLALGALGDERAVPTLLGVLLDTTNPVDMSFAFAALSLSRCGPIGLESLAAALDHHDPRVRRAAVVGVDCSGDPRSEELLARMEADPDPSVRERAKQRLGKPQS